MYMKLVPLAAALAFSMPTQADEASVKKALEGKLGAPVTSVTKTPYLGLYEVYADGQIIYTDEKVSALLVGSLIDGKTMKNVTTERMQKLTAIKFSELPLALAVKQVRGDGKRVFATFEDPNCGYCKKLAQELRKLDDVTVYTFIIPILGQDSSDKSRAIWCSADRNKAWNDWITAGVQPGGGQCDTAALQKNLDLANRYRIQGTPTMFFSNGERAPGYMVAAQIEQRLAAVK